MESVTEQGGGVDRWHHVLNAFRHHGIGHVRFLEAFRLAQKCSTPSGIMESVTCVVIFVNAKEGRCSTPSGIMESVTEAQPVSGMLPCVLNAFRHHGIGHGIVG